MPYSPPRHNARPKADRAAAARDYNRKQRNAASQKVYDSATWKKVRALQKQREPLCKLCKAEGRVTLAQVVDHIIPITSGGAAYDLSNLQSLCHLHHNQKTANDSCGGRGVKNENPCF